MKDCFLWGNRVEDAQKAYEGAGKLLGVVRNLLDPKPEGSYPDAA